MTYTEKYNELIAFRKANPITNGYYEVHHIQPSSLCGSDDADNLVRLTAAEHLRAHYYLLMMARERGLPMTLAKMTNAFQMMGNRGVIPNLSESELGNIGDGYQRAREFASMMSSIMNRGSGNPMYGQKHSEETKRKIAKSISGRVNANYGKRGVLSPNYGRKHTEATKQKIREANLGKHYTEETNRRISESKMGEKNPSYGKHWWNDSHEEIFSKDCPTGFVAGRLKRKSQ